MRKVQDEKFHTISPEDFDLFHLTDDVDEAVQYVHDCFTGKRTAGEKLPRFAEDAQAPAGEGTRLGIEPRKGGRLRKDYDTKE